MNPIIEVLGIPPWKRRKQFMFALALVATPQETLKKTKKRAEILQM